MSNPMDLRKVLTDYSHDLLAEITMGEPEKWEYKTCEVFMKEALIAQLEAIINLAKQRASESSGDYADALGMFAGELEEVKKVLSSNEKE